MAGEENPIGEIVDLDSFKSFAAHYTATLRPQTKNIVTIYDRRLTYPGERPLLMLYKSPWDEVPQSLQEMLRKQYDAARGDGPKTVDTIFFEKKGITPKGDDIRFTTDRRMIFTLASPQVERGWDRTDGVFVGNGLTLHVNTDEWSFLRIPAAIASGLSQSVEDLTAFEARMRKMGMMKKESREPLSLPQAKDVAGFLNASRARAHLLIDQKGFAGS